MSESQEAVNILRWNHFYEGSFYDEGSLMGLHAEVCMEDSPKAPSLMPETIESYGMTMRYLRSEPYCGDGAI
jgi:hypothetical protein